MVRHGLPVPLPGRQLSRFLPRPKVGPLPLPVSSASGVPRKRRTVVPVLRRALLLALGIAAAVCLGTAAWAFFSSAGIGNAVAGTGNLNAPTAVTASAPLNSSTVTVNWTAGQLSSGQPATGYYVLRIRTSDNATFPACGTSIISPAAGLTCADTGVTDGTYRYTVTALFGSWTAAGPSSSNVTVVNNTGLPSINVSSINPSPNSNGYNNTSPVTVSLAASGGAGVISITYALDGGTPVTVLGSTAAVQVAGDGIHTLTYSAKDLLLQDSATGTVLVRIDRAAPAAPSAPALTAASDSGASATDRITNVTAPTFTGTAETGATITLYDGTTTIGTATATDGTYTITSNTLPVGTRSITAKATDLAGNTSPASTATSVTIDTTAPAAPSAPALTAASDSGTSATDRITRINTPTLTGTTETGTTITLYNGATATGTSAATGAAYGVTSSALTAGTKTLTVAATDTAGNTGPKSAATSVTFDYTAPGKPGRPVLAAASDTGRSATDNNTRITTPTLTGTATTGTVVTVYDGATPVGTATATTGYSVTTSTLATGTRVLTARASDVAGNLSTSSTARNVIIDTTAPAAPPAPVLSAASDTGRSNNDKITKTTAPVITGTNETRAIVSLYDGATQVGTRTTTSTSYSITSATLAPGTRALTVTATDIAGNTGTSSPATAITIDTIAPAAPSAPALTTASDTGISTTDGITKTTTPATTGTAESGATITLFDAGTATGTAVTATGGTYTATTGTLTAGTHTLTATATDAAGNGSFGSASTNLTIDTIAPTVTINQAAGQPDPTTGTTIEYTAVSSENIYGLTGAGVTFTGTAGATTATITGSGTSYAVAVSGMIKTGTVTPRISAGTAQDVAGNLTVASTTTDSTVTYTDATPPSVTISSFEPAANRTATLTGTASTAPGDGTTVTIVLYTVNVFPCTAGNTKATLTPTITPATGTWAITSGSLGANSNLYARTTQTDASANTGQSTVAGPLTIPDPPSNYPVRMHWFQLIPDASAGRPSDGWSRWSSGFGTRGALRNSVRVPTPPVRPVIVETCRRTGTTLKNSCPTRVVPCWIAEYNPVAPPRNL